jgi:predicted transglutaminase-like cysteine proteinase
MRRNIGCMKRMFLIMTMALPPLLCQIVANAVNAAPAQTLFGTQELRNGNLKPFTKWTRMLERFSRDEVAESTTCTATATNKCHTQRWQELIDQQKGHGLASKLQAVNSFVNKTPYKVDAINWGVGDYWATPGQFFVKYGDCEDYAVAKYLTLKRLGVDASRMRIVVLQDIKLRVPHAVLAVYTDGDIIILDNQIKRPVWAAEIRHYRPIYSINEDAWWLHRAKGSMRRKKRI